MYTVSAQTCCSKHAIHHDLFEPGDSLVDRFRDQDAFARRETASLENDVEATCLDVFYRLIEFARYEHAKLRGRDGVPLHESFGEGLGSLHARCQRRWSEHGDAS